MVKNNNACNMCNGRMVKVGERQVGDTRYNILKCEKCNHQVAKSTD